MLKIAICDDLERDREKIIHSLTEIETKLKVDFEIAHFVSGEELCVSLRNSSYDIILLDILMDGMDGIETAKRIRLMGVESVLIFISSFNERWREMFGVQTTAFLDKPFKIDELTLIIRDILTKLGESDIYTFKIKNQEVSIPLNEIIFFESYRNKITLNTIYNSYTFYGTISTIWEELKENAHFVKPRSSHLFNLKFVDIVSGNIVVETHGATINIGRSFKEDTLSRYFEYRKNRRML